LLYWVYAAETSEYYNAKRHNANVPEKKRQDRERRKIRSLEEMRKKKASSIAKLVCLYRIPHPQRNAHHEDDWAGQEGGSLPLWAFLSFFSSLPDTYILLMSSLLCG
jgi:hypothetical protein